MPESDPALVDGGLGEPTEGEASAAASEAPASVADDVLLAAHELARAALLEITPETSVGEVVGHLVEGEHVLSLLFACTLPGYPGWHWTVTVARVDEDSAPVVVEAELLPGESALLAPEWVPWAERLAEYKAAQAAARAAGEPVDEELAGLTEDAGDSEGAADAFDDDDDEFDDDDLDEVRDDGIDVESVEAEEISGVEFAALEPESPSDEEE